MNDVHYDCTGGASGTRHPRFNEKAIRAGDAPALRVKGDAMNSVNVNRDEVTPPALFFNRRQWMRASAAVGSDVQRLRTAGRGAVQRAGPATVLLMPVSEFRRSSKGLFNR